MNIFLGILIGVFCLVLLVTAHELGHFIMARRSGVRVLEFGICFPPRAVAWIRKPKLDENGKPLKKKNGKPAMKWEKLPKSEWGKPQKSLVLSLNWLPIGGFCQMDGESDADTRKGTFGAASFWGKTKILFGGVLMNWLAAFVILTILAWVGMPQFLTNQFSVSSDERKTDSAVVIASVAENSPAERAGFLEGDTIKSINGTPVSSAYDELFQEFAGEEVEYEILRTENEEEVEKTLTATLNEEDNEWGYLLGVSMSMTEAYSYYTWSAPIVGAGTTLQLTTETFSGLGQLVGNLVTGIVQQINPDGEVREAGRAAISTASEGVTGPIGIVGTIFPSFATSGFSNIAFLFALISVSLACMNVLPIPALDGGRWLMIFIARLKHTRLTKEKEQKLVARSLVVLLIIAAVVSILDILRLF